MSVSEPSWLFGNTRISTRPPLAASTRSAASVMRTVSGWMAGVLFAILSVNSAAWAGRVLIANSGRAAVPSRARRLMVMADVSRLLSLPSPYSVWPPNGRAQAPFTPARNRISISQRRDKAAGERMIITRILGALAALLLATAAQAQTVRIARQPGLSYLPLILMQDAQLLEDEGRKRGLDLATEWLVFTGGPPINDAMISGNIDIAAGGVGPMLTLWARTRTGLRVKGLAALGNMPIWLNSNSPAVRTIKDLTERDRIALPGVKVSIQAVVLQMAAQQAWGAGQQYRLDPLTVSMGHPDGQAALLGNSEVTAHFTAAPFMYEELGNARVHRILNSYDVLGGPHTFNVVWATTRWHDANPKVAAAFMAALDRALRMIIEDPAATAAVWMRVEKARLPAQQIADYLRRPENEWTTTPRRMMAFMTFMADTGAITQRAETWRDLFFPALHAADGN